ncbi:MAG: 2-oxo acid dehydrogenase subunit E2 [Dehalococcoidia bacterium]|nr:2-oxo acid dehydrogenase subunit E2 [Dehalococcoidia bacterium]
MPIEFRLPDLGENVDEAELLKVLVSLGDLVKIDDSVLELETEKAVFEVPSSVAGTVTKIHVKQGDTLETGQLLFTLEPAGTAETAVAAAPPRRAAAAARPAAAPAATPAAAPAATPAAVPVATAPPRPLAPSPADDVAARDRAAGRGVPAFAAPSVRKFARQIGVDIYQVRGSGPGGRISVEDVQEFARHSREQRDQAPRSGTAPPPPLPDFSPFGATHRERMNGVRRATAQGMALSWATIPHVTLHAKADVTALEDFRQRYKKTAEAAGARLTLLAIMIKIVAAGLKAFPKLNASGDMESREIVFKDYYHLGVAVDTERGLLVPVMRDIDRKNIVEIAIELGQLAEKARAGKLSLDEMRGASFTISNLGGFGTGFFTPVINYPEVGVLGVGRAEMEPVYIDGEFRPRLRLPLSLAIDHRVVDGADGSRFLQWLVDAVNEPLLVALEG